MTPVAAVKVVRSGLGLTHREVGPENQADAQAERTDGYEREDGHGRSLTMRCSSGMRLP
jgi:hypothetical protein